MRHLQQLGNRISVPITADEDGFTGRECPNAKCEGYAECECGTGAMPWRQSSAQVILPFLLTRNPGHGVRPNEIVACGAEVRGDRGARRHVDWRHGARTTMS